MQGSIQATASQAMKQLSAAWTGVQPISYSEAPVSYSAAAQQISKLRLLNAIRYIQSPLQKLTP